MNKEKSKVLTALVLAGVLSGVGASVFASEMPKPEIFGDYQDLTFSYDNKDFITLRVWDNGTNVVYPAIYIGTEDEKNCTETVTRGLLQAGDKNISKNSLLKDEVESLKEGLHYIYDLIGSPKNGKVPVMHLILDKKDDSNAHASSDNNKTSPVGDFAKYFIAGCDVSDSIDFYAASMTIDLPKSDIDYCLRNDVLPELGLSDAHTGTVIHEMVHVLGISVYREDTADKVNHTIGEKTYPYQNYKLSSVNIYTRALHDAFGETSFTEDAKGKITKVISYQDYQKHVNGKTIPEDAGEYFYMVENDSFSGNYFMPVDKDGDPKEESNVYQVLDLDNGTKIAWPDDAEMSAVAGLPINGWEESDGKIIIPELSHVELQNGLMSHQSYRNWSVLMEAEIALLQDIGYSIDRSKFYGGSWYGSDFEEFSALEKSFTSDQAYAIGYHVYGSNNAVKTGAEIKPTGYGAVGIRVDGVDNEITVNKKIEVTGERSTGVMFSYGNGHTLTVSEDVKATGDNSIGLQFDFGDNYVCNKAEYRGSYIRGEYTATKNEKGNNGWYDLGSLTALTGPLMKKVSINADIIGTSHAIYISQNAYVKELNIGEEDGECITITGNITSEWNPTGVLFTAKEAGNTSSSATDLKLNKEMLGEIDPATLTTDLQMNSDVTVVGNIKGAASLDMTIAEDTITLVTGDVAVHALKSEGGTLKVGYQKKVDTGNYSGFTGNIVWEEGNVEGSWLKTFNQGTQTGYTERRNQSNTALSQMNTAAVMGWRAQNNDMNKRLGDLRMKNGEKGVWVRMSRGENKEDATKRQFNLYQVGYDQEIGNKWILGGALSMTKGNANTSSVTGYAKGEDKSGAFSLYASRLNDDGTFVDLVAKYGKITNDVKSYMVTGMGSYDYSTPAMSVSAEIGKRIKKGSCWIEPQAEFTFGMVKSANYTTSNGVSAEQERFNTAVGRVGAVFGVDFPQGNVYIRASFLHDFAGNSDLRLIQDQINRSHTNDLGGNWGEFGIGTNFKIGKSSYAYADLEKTCGGKMQTPWRWNLGMRFSF